jgi:hypothetical protein
MQIRGVFCEVRTYSVCIIQINFALPKGRTVAEVDGVFPRGPGFDPRSVRERFVFWKVAVGTGISPSTLGFSPVAISPPLLHTAQIFLRVFRVSPLSVSVHHCSIRIFIYMLLLPEGLESEGWEPTKKQRPFVKRGVLDR